MSKPLAMFQQNTQHMRVMNSKYRAKYKKLKERIKYFVIENGALSDEVAQVQAELTIAKEERRFLIKRLLRHEGVNANTNSSVTGTTEEQNKDEEKQRDPIVNVPKKRGAKKRRPSSNVDQANSGGEKLRPKSRGCVVVDKLSLNANGKPIFPINLYNILIHSPGEILPSNPNFHNAHWIYPVGYVATRIYAHPRDPRRRCVYTCKILNNAGAPQFQIIPDNDLDSVFFGESANFCHQALLEALQRSLADVVKLPHQPQGEKFFGLANPTVKSLIQMDPAFKQCSNFKHFTMQEGNFTMLEEKDPTMNFDALQSLITISAYHTMPEVRDKPPEELFEFN